MKLGGRWNSKPYDLNTQKNAFLLLDQLIELGFTFFDHADIYTMGKSECLFGEWLNQNPGLRKNLFIQTKCGICLPGFPQKTDVARYDFSYKHITESTEKSLERLKCDYLDTLVLHRPDILVEPEEVNRAFHYLHDSGKVKQFGVSNHTPMQIALLQKYLDFPLIVNQIQISLLYPDLISNGIQSHLPTESIFSPETAGTLEFCRLHDLRIQAWSPLANGLLSDKTPSKKTNPKLITRLENIKSTLTAIAKEYATNKEALALAWLMRHPTKIRPVIGSTKIKRVKTYLDANRVAKILSYEDWYRLLAATA